MGFLITVILILLIFAGVIFYFFNLAFVKQDMGDVDDLNSPVNKPLEQYKEIIQNGIDHIRSTAHTWHYTVSFDGLRLAARYFDNNSKNTVILFHGYRSSSARDFSCAVKMYMNFGCNVLLCDQRCSGRSEGKLITFGVKERYDVKVWAEYAAEKLGAEKIILGGMSMGATTVLLSLGLDLPEQVKIAIVDCGFTSPVDIIKKVSRDSFKINAGFFIPILNLCCKIFGNFSIYGVNTKDVLKNSDLPVLFIHGKADKFVPCSMSEEAFSVANSKCRIVTVEEAQHGLCYLIDPDKINNNIKEFIKENL